MSWSIATADAIGGRSEQQDRVGAWHDTGHGAVLAVVADGVGGHHGGAQAAQIVLDTANEFWSRSSHPVPWPQDLLTDICLAAHERINAMGDNSGSDPASTCVILYADDKVAAWAHVGDSRVYHFRNGKPVGRTKDHSVVQLLVEQGEIAESEMASHPDQNLILQSLGGDRAPKVSFDQISIEPGDGFVLCSDGLWEMMQPEEMAAALSQQDLPAAAIALAGEAVRRGGARGDNVSIAMVSHAGRRARSRPLPKALRAAAGVARRFSALLATPARFGRQSGSDKLNLAFRGARMAGKIQFSLILGAWLVPLAQALAAECPEHAEMKYVTTQGDTRTTYCACVAGYSNQGGVCKPIATHNWRIDLPKLAHDAETAAGNSQPPASGASQR